MLQTLLDSLFPRRSLGGRDGAWITPSERALLRSCAPVQEECAALRGRGIEHLDRLFAACNYREAPLLRAAVWRFKYRRVQALGDELAALLAACAPEHDDHDDRASVLCPVPLHWMRRFQRGFNQAEILASAIGERRSMVVHPLLQRVRATGHQAHRDRETRRAAIGRSAFRVHGDVPPHVILIDDIATTGATLDACAAALKGAGAQCVEAWVLAKG